MGWELWKAPLLLPLFPEILLLPEELGLARNLDNISWGLKESPIFFTLVRNRRGLGIWRSRNLEI